MKSKTERDNVYNAASL